MFMQSEYSAIYIQSELKHVQHSKIMIINCNDYRQITGADPGFSFRGGGGGGAQKIMCPHAHSERAGTELTFGRGPEPYF